jgi:hypothetical protein
VKELKEENAVNKIKMETRRKTQSVGIKDQKKKKDDRKFY